MTVFSVPCPICGQPAEEQRAPLNERGLSWAAAVLRSKLYLNCKCQACSVRFRISRTEALASRLLARPRPRAQRISDSNEEVWVDSMVSGNITLYAPVRPVLTNELRRSAALSPEPVPFLFEINSRTFGLHLRLSLDGHTFGFIWSQLTGFISIVWNLFIHYLTRSPETPADQSFQKLLPKACQPLTPVSSTVKAPPDDEAADASSNLSGLTAQKDSARIPRLLN